MPCLEQRRPLIDFLNTSSLRTTADKILYQPGSLQLVVSGVEQTLYDLIAMVRSGFLYSFYKTQLPYEMLTEVLYQPGPLQKVPCQELSRLLTSDCNGTRAVFNIVCLNSISFINRRQNNFVPTRVQSRVVRPSKTFLQRNGSVFYTLFFLTQIRYEKLTKFCSNQVIYKKWRVQSREGLV